MNIRDKLLKNSTVDETATLTNSKFYKEKDMVKTPVPMINVALSGSIHGGLCPGITTIAGPSKHFKTGFSLLLAKAFLEKHPDGCILFYDTEFGTPQNYFETFGISLDSVVHTPITDVEQLRHDVRKQLEQLTREDKVLIILDSIGNAASRKETEDALSGNDKSDVGNRAKVIKSLFRICTAHLMIKDIPMVVIGHVYETMEMFSKTQLSGGTGIYYSSQDIWFIGRRQDKDAKTKEISGYDFIINIEKSRMVKEKSKIPITISFDGGIYRWSGLLNAALDTGHIVSSPGGWYIVGSNSSKKVQQKDMDDHFWEAMLEDDTFSAAIQRKYKLAHANSIV